MIKPTVGRVVHFFQNSDQVTPFVALIACVHSDTCVNIAVFDSRGRPLVDPPTSIRLVQPDEDLPESGPYCKWMTYQVKKDFGGESGEKEAGTENISLGDNPKGLSLSDLKTVGSPNENTGDVKLDAEPIPSEQTQNEQSVLFTVEKDISSESGEKETVSEIEQEQQQEETASDESPSEATSS